MEAFVQIGKTQKAHSIKGELKLNVEERFIDDLFEQEALFLKIKGQYVPYFIEELREGNMMILKLEDIDSRSAAEALGHKEIYLRREDIQLSDEEVAASGLQYGHLEGFMIVDQELGEIACIDEVAEFPQQEMGYIRYRGKLRLIPLNENLIIQVEKEQKIVRMKLPEGLLEL